jgi:hypothetical protein
MFILLPLLGIAHLICAIMILIKQFKTAGAVHGIIGIVTCFIWTFIWGWLNAGRLNIRNIMIIWTVIIILLIVVELAFGASIASQYSTPVTP